MKLSWARLEDHEENVPGPVRAAARALLLKALLVRSSEVLPELEEVSGWKLTLLDLGYRRPPGGPKDVMEAIVENTAVNEMQERLDDLEAEEPYRRFDTFTLGAPEDGVIVLAQAPEAWWGAEPLEKLVKEGVLRDTTYGNDACPSLGIELADGGTLQIFTGHPHPDHHTRQDACDPRFAIFMGDGEWQLDFDNGPAWQGESEEEAARQVRKLVQGHGGPRRQSV